MFQSHAIVGDGYRETGKSSPFTDYETFAGITVDAAANVRCLVAMGRILISSMNTSMA